MGRIATKDDRPSRGRSAAPASRRSGRRL